MSTLYHILRNHANRLGEHVGYTFLADSGGESRFVSYREIDRNARVIAGELQRRNQVGKPVALFFPPGLDYVEAFWGCLYAGAIAVPAYPPGSRRMLPRIRAIIDDCGVEVVLSSESVRQRAHRMFGEGGGFSGLEWVISDSIDRASVGGWQEPIIDESTLAFLQYTSGSTGNPKGVMVSHGNLIANERMIEKAFGHGRDTVVVGWLPPYHDMGLIGNLLQPLYLGVPSIMMAPAAAMQSPISWLRAISDFRATTSGCPNFFYDLCVEKLEDEEIEQLDLNCWKVAFNGAEPVRTATMDRFSERFAPCGFNRKAFLPCYGLAEGTLMVTGAPHMDEPTVASFSRAALERGVAERVASGSDDAALLASSGSSVSECQVIVVDPASSELLEDGKVGEIWVHGSNVAQGYWGKESLSDETFRARLSGGGERDFLRTGDLGVLNDGELYVVGRIKDLIIIRGRNFYPHDIEAVSERSHSALRVSGAAAIVVEEDNEERLVVLQEVDFRQKPDGVEAINSIRRAVFDFFEIRPHRVVLLKAGSLPKTSSGKIQRVRSKRLLLADELPVIADSSALGTLTDAPGETIEWRGLEERIGEVWSRLLNVETIRPSDDFFAVGGDSLSGMQLIAQMEKEYGVRIKYDSLFEYASLRSFSEYIEKERSVARERKQWDTERELPLDASFPLNSTQQRIWFFQQWDASSSLYNIPAAIRLKGKLDRTALQSAYATLLSRHEALRTRLISEEGVPSQVFDEALDCSIGYRDLSKNANIEGEMRRLALEDSKSPFDLEKDPLVRASLLKLADDEHTFLICIHHIIADGWSLTVMLSELAELYARFEKGEVLEERSSSRSYTRFLQRCGSRAADGSRKVELSYWKDRLGGAPATLEFPYARSRPRMPSFEGERIDFAISSELAKKAKAESASRGITLYMYLLGVFKVLLYRHTGQSDIVVGSPIAGRHRSGSETLVGLFINTLALRTKVDGDEPFSRLLEKVKGTTVGAYAHQEVAFEDVLRELKLERDLKRSPVFQVLFQLQKAPLESVEMGSLVATPTETDNGTVKLDLVFNIVETGDGLACSIRFSKDLFERGQIEALRRHFEVLLDSVVKSPEAKVDSIPLLVGDERMQVIEEWNATAKDYGKAELLHSQFEAQVERAPNGVALISDGGSLNYAELNGRANQLARWLRAQGVVRESCVAVCMERGWEMVVSLMAILKSGGAYAPFDPEYPVERLRHMHEDLGQPIVLLQRKWNRLVDDCGARRKLIVDAEWDSEVDSYEETNLDVEIDSENLAYVIYTSGSTGKPKGVANRHVSICNRINWMQDEYGLDESDNVLQKTPYSFDVSVWEFFWPLVTGARLTMAKPGGHRESRYIADTIIEQEVTTIHFVPSMLRLFLEEPNLDRLKSLKRVFASGEALPGSLWASYQARIKVPLHNLYGPTEAAVDVTYHQCQKGATDRIVPIGRPIANTSIYILNKSGEPTPIGVPGELYIGGTNLARGYLNRRELTEERFVANPFSNDKAARLYRTGDLCCYRSDGKIDYIERLDFQVKLRGFRIELGEIESAMRDLEDVEDVVVTVANQSEGADSFLCAYFVGDDSLSIGEFRERLSTILPEYMVPSTYVRLDALPLSSNGKLDRKALPEPTLEKRLSSNVEYVAPSDSLEEFVAEIWREALHIERVGRNDHFFETGGNSIQGAVVINRIQEKIGEIVHIVAIFDHPILKDLAEFLRSQYAESVTHVFGASSESEANAELAAAGLIQVKDIERLRRSIPSLAKRETAKSEKNSRAIFILSPPRSGSTLLRVLLGGHPDLFAPPELELLCFNTLQERKAAFSGRDRFSLEGTIRAFKELNGGNLDEAERLMEGFEAANLSIKALYKELQDRIGDRILVDKTPSYPLDLNTLKRAEDDFEEALYIHLARHPLGMMRSFCEAHLEQVFCRYDHHYSSLQLAELIWTISQQNIQSFLKTIPSHRQLRIRFEDLVAYPDQSMAYLSGFIGLDSDRRMLDPYEMGKGRMTDGLHSDSRMLGDVKFHDYEKIESSVADRWRESMSENMLGSVTRELASEIGYQIESEKQPQGATRSSDLTIIPQQNGEAPGLLSFSQERLWFLSQIEPDSFAYNVPGAVEIKGVLNRPAMEKAFKQILQRHESLRTVFPKVDGRPSLLVFDEVETALEFIDRRAAKEGAEVDADTRDRMILEESRKPFNLSEGPLIRAKLVKLAEERHLLLVTMHHIVSDGWSLGVLVKELKTRYSALRDGRELPFEELDVQYSHYARWQRSLVNGEALKANLDFWAETLRGDLPPLELPMDRPRPATTSYRGARLPVRVNAKAVGTVRRISSEHGTTVFTTLLAMFKVLLKKYSESNDIIVGTTIANRHHREVEDLIGCFVNTLVLRSQFEDAFTLLDCIEEVKSVSRSAYEHQDTPFEKIVERVNPERRQNISPIFQVFFSYQNAQREDLSLPGLDIEMIEIDNGTSKFDLSLNLVDLSDTIEGHFEYSCDLFDRSTIEDIAADWARVLEFLADTPQIPIEEIALERHACLREIPEEERIRLLREFNATTVEYPSAYCIHQIIEQRVVERGDAIAVECNGKTLSYSELDAQANRLANALRKRHGVGPDRIVGLMTERSLDMFVGLVAVLKSGAAYLPIDPTYPEERIRFMLDDSECEVLLTQSDLPHANVFGGVAIELDRELPLEIIAPTNLEPNASSNDLAYLIYTSGSTGKPKGVMIEHRNVVNFMKGMEDAVGLQRGQKILSATTICFDIFVLESLVPLMLGMEIVLGTESEQRDPASLNDLIWRSGVQIIQATPSLFNAILSSHRSRECLAGVERFIVGGEAFPQKLFRQIRSVSSSDIFNVYGPTETTVWSTVSRLESDVIDIGRPIANTQIYMVGENSVELVGCGEIGELCIGGDGLAQGYWKRSELTEEKFVSNPFDLGKRMYRTGDLARWLPDGRIECLGRIDNQVKIRGHRIEVGEIEAALGTIKGLIEVVVVAKEIRQQNTLVAYYTSDRVLESGTLRRALEKTLPVYMIPAYFERLETIPLTSNGKFDRKSLPMPSLGAKSSGPKLKPRNEKERIITEIWKEVLGFEEVGISDNFFDLGGNSLLIVEVQSKLETAFGKEIAVAEVFNRPTITKLGEYFDGDSAQALKTEEIEVRTDRRKRLAGRGQAKRKNVLRRM